MSEGNPVLPYGRTPRRRRWLLWALLLLLVVAIGLLYSQRQPLSLWWNDIQRFRNALNAPAPNGVLVISTPEDAAATDASTLLNAFASRARIWTRIVGPACTDMRIVSLTQTMNSPGDPGLAALRCLTTPSGTTRLAALGVNITVVRNLSRVIMSFHLELYKVGTYRNPHFTAVQAQSSRTPGDFSGNAANFRWITFDAIHYRPGSSIVLDAPTVAASDPATLRWPITIDGHQDALLFTLGENEVVTLKMESGAKLPLQIGFAPSAATTKASKIAKQP